MQLPPDELACEELPWAELAGEELAGEELAGEELAGEELAGEEFACAGLSICAKRGFRKIISSAWASQIAAAVSNNTKPVFFIVDLQHWRVGRGDTVAHHDADTTIMTLACLSPDEIRNRRNRAASCKAQSLPRHSHRIELGTSKGFPGTIHARFATYAHAVSQQKKLSTQIKSSGETEPNAMIRLSLALYLVTGLMLAYFSTTAWRLSAVNNTDVLGGLPTAPHTGWSTTAARSSRN
jgi:hypothetical protein